MRDATAERIVIIRQERDAGDFGGGIVQDFVLGHVGEVDEGGVIGGFESAAGVEGAG